MCSISSLLIMADRSFFPIMWLLVIGSAALKIGAMIPFECIVYAVDALLGLGFAYILCKVIVR